MTGATRDIERAVANDAVTALRFSGVAGGAARSCMRAVETKTCRIVVESRDAPHDTIVDEILAALFPHLGLAADEEQQS
jgi:hypothetical protein